MYMRCNEQFPHKKRCQLFGGFLPCCVQSGKSYTLNSILPALLRHNATFGVGAPKEVVVFRMSMDKLSLELVRLRAVGL